MSKLKELEKRLKDEPENLGLRVALAGALLEAGRRADAIELYHSVAMAYRDHGRTQQAITVCRSLLELAPEHAACQELLTALTVDAPVADEPPRRAARLTPPQLPPSEPPDLQVPYRSSSSDMTPLPAPLAYHEADPTWIAPQVTRAELPPSLQQELALIPEIAKVAGIAHAAGQISAALLAVHPPEPEDEVALSIVGLDDEDEHAAEDAEDADELADSDDGIDLTDADDGFDLRRRARMDPHAALEHLGTLRPTVPLGRPARSAADGDDAEDGDDGDDELTLPPDLGAIPRARADEDEKTLPREMPIGARGWRDAGPTWDRARGPGATDRAPVMQALLDAADRGSAGASSTAPETLDARTDHDPLAPETLDSRTDHDRLAPEALDSRTDHEGLPPARPVAHAPTAPEHLDDRPVAHARTAPEHLDDRPAAHAPSVPDRVAAQPSARVDHPRAARERIEASDALHAVTRPAPAPRPPLTSARPAPPAAPAGSQELPRIPAVGSQELPRFKPPSIAPATHATGALESGLFAPVPPRNRVALLQRFRRRIAAIGTTVIRRGETGHGLVLVVRGQLDVHAERADGARVSLEAIGAGDYVGEIGLVARAPATAYVVAVAESELLVLDAADFYEVAGQFPLLWAAVAAVASRRVLEYAQRLQV